MAETLRGIGIVGGVAEGPALVTREGVAFNLGVDMASGKVVERGHELEGQCLKGRVLVCRGGKGSGGLSYGLLQVVANGQGPVAIVAEQADALIAAGAVLANIPLVHKLAGHARLRTGCRLQVDGGQGCVMLLDE
jgi:predicted aconitase with swiveling domain